MKNKATFGLSFSLLLLASCGKGDLRSQVQSLTAEEQDEPVFELAGIGDASCQLTYQLVKKVTGRSSASVFYEADSGNLVSRQAGLQTDFGDGCFSYCTNEFQSLKTRYGAERVLLRNCNFVRSIATASVKGLINSYTAGTVKGFACKYGQETAVDVEIFLGGASGVGVFAGRTKANLAPADETDRLNLAKECATTAAVHRFSFLIPEALRTQNPGKAIFVHAIDAANSAKNFAIGDSGKFMIAGLPAKTCPAGYIMVPASNVNGLGNANAKAGHPDWWLDTSKDFCVMKYPAKNVNGVAKSVQQGLPWTGLPRGLNEAEAGSALKSCKDNGIGYRLVSNTQWQTIARNAESVAKNWSGSASGKGSMAKGHTDVLLPDYILLDNLGSDTDGYYGTKNSAAQAVGSGWEQRRTNTLSNNEVVWDFGGNVVQWVSDNAIDAGVWNTTSSANAVYVDFDNDNYFPALGRNRLLFAPRGAYNNSSNNIGLFQFTANIYSGAIQRGGSNYNYEVGGLFAGSITNTQENGAGVGFRCAFLP